MSSANGHFLLSFTHILDFLLIHIVHFEVIICTQSYQPIEGSTYLTNNNLTFLFCTHWWVIFNLYIIYFICIQVKAKGIYKYVLRHRKKTREDVYESTYTMLYTNLTLTLLENTLLVISSFITQQSVYKISRRRRNWGHQSNKHYYYSYSYVWAGGERGKMTRKAILS